MAAAVVLDALHAVAAPVAVAVPVAAVVPVAAKSYLLNRKLQDTSANAFGLRGVFLCLCGHDGQVALHTFIKEVMLRLKVRFHNKEE
ncbi:hypothetical protein [Paenibacillus sp. MMO-177]|uniref:hypothetical protein n=1 Tax=Paenibacillus sp. MMO-177 TaxID=3081289 RepID=UPI00301758EC